MVLFATYLEAIQAVPGDTPAEKFGWIHRLILERKKAGGEMVQIIESDELPRALLPLVQAQAARKALKQSELILNALKSDDRDIINVALQANWFFDGNNRDVMNGEFFATRVFPYVSLKVRRRLIKRIAARLQKHPNVAEELFKVVRSTYGLDEAMPLLSSCSEDFIYELIVDENIILPVKSVKTLFKKNPDFVVRYFKLAKREGETRKRIFRQIPLHLFSRLIQSLIKKRLKDFVEIFEMQRLMMTLSNKNAQRLLNNGMEYVLNKAKQYILILPLKSIDEARMRKIFPKLLPEDVDKFDTDRMLNYLGHYPRDKVTSLFLQAYKDAYKQDLLENLDKVTPSLLCILPAEDRIRVARKKLVKDKDKEEGVINYSTSWRCYLPTSEALPKFREQISKTAAMEARAYLIIQMLYCCNINEDDSALAQTLTYFKDRHKNEIFWFQSKVMQQLYSMYDYKKLNKEHWAILEEVIQRLHVKNELDDFDIMPFFEGNLYFRIINNMPLDWAISLFVENKINKYHTKLNILTDYPEYERIVLGACLRMLPQKAASLIEVKRYTWMQCVLRSMYDFNKKHEKHIAKVKPIFIKDYPWLMEKVKIYLDEDDPKQRYSIVEIKALIEDNEKDLFYTWYTKEKPDPVLSIISGEALAELKKNPQNVLQYWEEYLKRCHDSFYRKRVLNFVRAIRWYRDIPLRFSEACQKQLENNDAAYFNILAVLLHGETFLKLVESMLPKDTEIDTKSEGAKNKYYAISFALCSMRYVEPPVPLDVIFRLLETDYLSIALHTLTNAITRTSVSKAIPLVMTLCDKRVTVKKHGIRMIYLVATLQNKIEFLSSRWKTETHYSIREVLYSRIENLFLRNPSADTWKCFSECLSSLTLDDQSFVSHCKLSSIPNEYLGDFAVLVFKIVDSLAEKGLSKDNVGSYFVNFLRQIDTAECDLMPEDFMQQLFQRFVFSDQQELANISRRLMIFSYFAPAEEKLVSRLAVFSKIFVKIVKTSWNVPHAKKPQYYPVNHGARSIVQLLVDFAIEDDNLESPIIDEVSRIYTSVVTPMMDPYSHILLSYLKVRRVTENPKEFGIKVASKIEELVAIYTPLMLTIMTRTMLNFLNYHIFPRRKCTEEVQFEVMEGLMESGNFNSCFVATKMLNVVQSSKNLGRFNEIVRRLREMEHPAIVGSVNNFINYTSFASSVSVD